MPVYLPTAVLGNGSTLLTLGHSGEIMGWFYPSKDHAQNIYQCMPCVYMGEPNQGTLYWTWGDEWSRRQEYQGDSNILVTTSRSETLGLEIRFTDVVPEDGATLARQISIRNMSRKPCTGSFFHYGDWSMGGIRTGNGVYMNRENQVLVQSHHDVTAVIGGSALETWQCGKAGTQWGSNALKDLEDGALWRQDLEIGDVNWAFGFAFQLKSGEALERTAIFALGTGFQQTLREWKQAAGKSFVQHCAEREELDQAWLARGLEKLQDALGSTASVAPGSGAETADNSRLPAELFAAYRRSLLCLPLLCGQEGAAVAAPEFDHEFISCGGYGYLWPRDGAEYVSGLMDAGYPEFAIRFFDWSAAHQDPAGLWHQRYFLNGEPGPNWCLPPDMLQIDQVGAVLWAYGKWLSRENPDPGTASHSITANHREMVRRAADYLRSRLTEHGVHANAFDTWESFIGSFTYSNSALYAAFKTAARVLEDVSYEEAATRVKRGVLDHFVQNGSLTRGFNGAGEPDGTIDSSALGAIEPFGLLDLNDEYDLHLAEHTLRTVREKLEVDWEGGRAIRRFEWDAYVGGVPACVNTLWMARCCLRVARRLNELGQGGCAKEFIDAARVYLTTVLRRTTPTGLLPELMQGPTGQRYWAAPHGWAMASFVSGVLMLAKELRKS